jgi:putative oxidoreductase
MKGHAMRRLLSMSAPAAVIRVRLLVRAIFLSEGVQKFLFPEALGPGRFLEIGIPAPHLMVPFVGGLEVVCGTLILVGLLTRPAACLLLVNSSVAIISTKLPILLGRGFWSFALPHLPRDGFWSMAHEARVDVAMWLGCLVLIIVGAGRLSLDAWLARREPSRHQLRVAS